MLTYVMSSEYLLLDLLLVVGGALRVYQLFTVKRYLHERYER